MYRQTMSIYARGNISVKKFSVCNSDVKARFLKAYCSSFIVVNSGVCTTLLLLENASLVKIGCFIIVLN